MNVLAGPRGWVARELYRPMAHKGPIGNPPRGPRGSTGFSDLGKILVKPSPGRVWGKLVHPKGSWVPWKPFPSQKILGNLAGNQSLYKVMFFGPPFLGPKRPWASQGLPLGLGAPKMGSGVKNIKVRESKTMQNPLVNAPNGAICCKLWPQTILGWGPQILGGQPLPIGQPLCPWGNPLPQGS